MRRGHHIAVAYRWFGTTGRVVGKGKKWRWSDTNARRVEPGDAVLVWIHRQSLSVEHIKAQLGLTLRLFLYLVGVLLSWFVLPRFYQLKHRAGYRPVDVTGYLIEGLESTNRATA